MRRAVVALAAAALAGFGARGAGAFNPDPRPAPGGAATVCADDAGVACSPSTADTDCASHTCVANIASAVEVRGTLTLIVDEDVTGWNDGADTSATRAENARLTLLLQYEHAGVLRTFAETYRLDGNGCILQTGDPDLCVPAGVGWNQPASEAVITDPQLNVVFTVPGAQVAHAIAAELTGDASTTALPYLAIVDRLPATTSSHGGSDPLASVQQLKVTIRLAP